MPSYITSTYSAIAVVLTLGFVVLAVWTKDMNALKEVTMLILGGYGVKKGMEIGKTGGTNGIAQPAPIGGETPAAPLDH